MHDFNDQRVVVTGGTRGIGRGIAEAFLTSGATVIATYARNDEAASKFKEELSKYGDKLVIKKFDVTKDAEVKAFYNEIKEEFPSIEVVVNNSGIRKDALLAMMKVNTWQDVIDTNLTGTYLMSRYAVLAFLRQRYGRIINISSIGGKMGLPGQANYAATKAGQIALSKSLSKEVAKKGITVNNVAPGFIETELISDLPEEQVAEYKKAVPMKKFGKVSDVANAVLFLASKESSYITGATIEVAGGL